MEQARADLQRSLIQTSSQFDQIESEKHGLTIALDELRRKNKLYLIFIISSHLYFIIEKFDIEKKNLLDELDMLRRAKETLDQEKSLRDQELRQIRDRSRTSSDDLKTAQSRIRALEQQVYCI